MTTSTRLPDGPPRAPASDLAASAALVVFWSSGFVGAELGTRNASPDTLLTWRYLLAGGLVLSWLALRRPRFTRRALGQHTVVGVLSQACYLGGVVTGVALGVPPGTAALIAALQPMVVAVASARMFGERSSTWQKAGLTLGLAGVGIVVAADLGQVVTGAASTTAAPWVYALPAGGMLALAGGTLLERKWRPGGDVLDALSVHTIASAVVVVGVTAASGRLEPPASPTFWWAVLWVVALSTFAAYGAYLAVLRRGGAVAVSALLYLTPPTTMVWAWLMFGDPPTPTTAAGLGVCAVAVALVLRDVRGRAQRHGLRASAN